MILQILQKGDTLMNLLPSSGQTYAFDWISLIYLFIVVIAVVLYVKKGFLYGVLSLFGIVIAFFAAYLLAKPMGEWLYSLNSWGDGMLASYNSFFVGKGAPALVTTGDSAQDLFVYAYFSSKGINTNSSKNVMDWIVSSSQLTDTAIFPSQLTAYAGKSLLDVALSTISLPSFLVSYVTSFVTAAVPASDPTRPLSEYLASSAAHLTFTAIAFAVLFVLFYILVIILKHFAKKLNNVKILGPVNRILGGVIGLVIGVFDVVLISALLTSLSGIEPVYNFLDSVLYLSDGSVYTVGKMIYENNFLGVLLGYYNSIAASLSLPDFGSSPSEAASLLSLALAR